MLSFRDSPIDFLFAKKTKNVNISFIITLHI
jgi:hypothetical protein